MIASMIGTRIRIRIGLTVWWEGRVLGQHSGSQQCAQRWKQQRASPACVQAGFQLTPVAKEENDSMNAASSTPALKLWECWSLTKLPSMVVAWSVHLEPYRKQRSFNIGRYNFGNQRGRWRSPAGRREPRTWAEGCRGTEPWGPSWLERSEVSWSQNGEEVVNGCLACSSSARTQHLHHTCPQPSPSSGLSLGTEEHGA